MPRQVIPMVISTVEEHTTPIQRTRHLKDMLRLSKIGDLHYAVVAIDLIIS